MCKADIAVVQFWLKKLHNNEEDNDAIIESYGKFRASFDDPESADLWTERITA